jgi:hypothetical protein
MVGPHHRARSDCRVFATQAYIALGRSSTMTLKEFDRFARRHRRKVSGLMVSMYVISGVTLMIGIESPRVQGLIHVAIGILHGLP